MSLLDGITARYSAFDAWAYDAIVAPAVISMRASLEDELLAEVPRGAEVLEVGCGGGQLAVHLAGRRSDLSIVGLDLSPSQVARAQRRARDVADRVRFIEGSALELPFGDGSFDAVVSVASIKHWPDPARGVAECARVLRPRGTLAILEADRGCRLDDARDFVGKWRLLPPMRPLALLLFRTFVAGQALDLDDARALLDGVADSMERTEARRIPGTPGLVMLARKAVSKDGGA